MNLREWVITPNKMAPVKQREEVGKVSGLAETLITVCLSGGVVGGGGGGLLVLTDAAQQKKYPFKRDLKETD